MIVFKTDQVMCYDIDDTIIMWNLEDKSKNIPIEDAYIKGVFNYVTPNENHIDLMKKHKARGMTIIVWSAGGVEHAESVIKALKLEEFVDAVFSKPSGYVDDLDVSEWIGRRIYIK
jgi:FMN phosphatase YigB (HAD superfamily)